MWQRADLHIESEVLRRVREKPRLGETGVSSKEATGDWGDCRLAEQDDGVGAFTN